jgi:hypothetical protein
MYRLVRAMTVAGMVAIGLQALTGAADAQQWIGWYEVQANYCSVDHWTDSNGVNHASIMVFPDILYQPGTIDPRFVYTVTDTPDISAILQFCHNGNYFWVYWDGTQWKFLQVISGML